MTAKSGGPLSVFGTNNRISGGILISGGNITVFGSDNSVSGSVELNGSGLLKLTGTSDKYSGSASENGDAAVQIYGKDNAMYGSLAINGGASLAVGSNALLAGIVTVNDSGHVDITGSNNRIAGGIVLDNSKRMTVAGSGNAVSGDLTDAGGAPIHISGSLLISRGVLTLESNAVITGSLTVNRAGAVHISGSNNVISGNVGLGTAQQGSGHGSTISRGILTASGSSNRITGSLLVKAGALTISGTGASLAVDGATTFASASFFGGGSLLVQDGASFTASGSVMVSSGTLSVASGGTISLPGLTSVPAESFDVDFSAQGTNSEINLSNLTSFAGSSNSIEDTNGATVLLNNALTSIDGAIITVDATAHINLGQLVKLTNGGLTVDGGSYTLSNLSDVDGSIFEVQDGGSLDLPAVDDIAYGTSAGFPATTFDAGNYVYPGNLISAGVISLPNLESISVPFYGVNIGSLGSGSQVAVPKLTTINGGSLSVTSDGSVLDGSLTSLNAVVVNLDGTGTIQTSQWVSLTNGTLSVSGDYSSTTSPPFASLSNIDGSTISVGGTAGDLTLPGVTSISIDSPDYGSTTLQAGDYEDGTLLSTGALSLPDLTTISTDGNYVQISAEGDGSEVILPELTSVTAAGGDSVVNIQAQVGGQILLPALTQVNANGPNFGEFGVAIESTGAGSIIDLTSLTTISAGGSGATLNSTSGGAISHPELTSLDGVTIVTDPTATLAVQDEATYSFTGGANIVQTGTFEIEGALSVQNTATLNVKGSITVDSEGAIATSPGSTIDVSGNLLGATLNSDAFAPQGNVVFDGAGGTSNPPQRLEAMSEDMGNVTAGYTNNFDYGTLKLTANTYVELVDQSANSPGNAPNAVYVNNLIVPSGATLNLNGLHLYAVSATVAGTITGGVISTLTDEWISTASGNWNVGSNWSTGAVPTANEPVIINVPGASPTITISSGSYSVYSIAASDPLSITGGSLTVAANSTISGGLSMTGGSLEANGLGVSLTVTGAVTVSSASLYAEGGATLAIPGLNNYAAPGFTTLEATGSGSVLDLSGLTSISDGSYQDTVEAISGGTVNLNSLATLAANLTLEAEYSGSVLNLPDLTSFTVGSAFAVGGADLLAENGAAVDCPQLEALNTVSLTVSDTASVSLGSVTNIDGSSVTAENGATVSLPGVTSYSSPGLTTLEATGTNSVLNLSKLSTISDTGYQTDIESLSGGTVNLNLLSTLVANVSLESQSSGSVLNIPDLMSFTVGSAFAVGGAARAL